MSLTRTMRFVFAALVATIAMGAAVSTANAATGASVTNGVTLATANGVLTLAASGTNVICNVTIGLQLNSSIGKSTSRVIGTVNSSSRIANCNLGITGTVLPGFAVNYRNFTGTLPNITSIGGRASAAAFLLFYPQFGQSCLYTGTVDPTFTRNIATGAITSVSLTGTGLTATPAVGCPQNGALNGTLTVLATQPIIRLI